MHSSSPPDVGISSAVALRLRRAECGTTTSLEATNDEWRFQSAKAGFGLSPWSLHRLFYLLRLHAATSTIRATSANPRDIPWLRCAHDDPQYDNDNNNFRTTSNDTILRLLEFGDGSNKKCIGVQICVHELQGDDA